MHGMSSVGDCMDVQNLGEILLIEPFYGGSHRQLVDLLKANIPQCTLVTLPPTKWHWRARTSALHFSFQIPSHHNFKVVFASSVLNLAELVALRPDLQRTRKVLYFHENQLVYPVRKHKDRDFQYGYNEILSCLIADIIVFNSRYNKESFLNSLDPYLKLMPDRPRNVAELIRPKCQILYFPINFPALKHDKMKIHTAEMKIDGMEDNDFDVTIQRGIETMCVSEEVCPLEDVKLCKTFLETRESMISSVPTVAKEARFVEDPELCAKQIEIVSRGEHAVEEEAGNEVDRALCPTEIKEANNLILDRERCTTFEHRGDIVDSSMPTVRTVTVENPNGLNAGSRVDMPTLSESMRNRTIEIGITGDLVESPELSNVEHEGKGPSYLKTNEPLHFCTHSNHERSTSETREGSLTVQGELGGLQPRNKRPLHIVWPHRWEHDKNPEDFFSVIFQLQGAGLDFSLSVLGESYQEVPAIFSEAKSKLCDHIIHWGYQPAKEEYFSVLAQADVVISTANHEFFGVAMLEAVHFGCYPMCPDRLVYPEIFPDEYIYKTRSQLLKKLKRFCQYPHLARNHVFQGDLSKYSWQNLKGQYGQILSTSPEM